MADTEPTKEEIMAVYPTVSESPEANPLALAPMAALSFFASLEPGFRSPWRPDLYARMQASFRACATLTTAWVHASAVENRRRWSRAELLAAMAVNEHYGWSTSSSQASPWRVTGIGCRSCRSSGSSRRRNGRQ